MCAWKEALCFFFIVLLPSNRFTCANVHTQAHTSGQICVSAFSLQYFSILIHHWPDMWMLSLLLSPSMSLSRSLSGLLQTHGIQREDKGRAGSKTNSRAGRALSTQIKCWNKAVTERYRGSARDEAVKERGGRGGGRGGRGCKVEVRKTRERVEDDEGRGEEWGGGAGRGEEVEREMQSAEV